MSGHDASRSTFEYVATTRRRWSKAEKQAILAEVDAAGGSVSEVARRHGLHTSLLFRWRRLKSGPPVAASAPTPKFIPLALPAPPVPASVPKVSKIEIVLSGGCTVRVETDVDVAALRRLLDALDRR